MPTLVIEIPVATVKDGELIAEDLVKQAPLLALCTMLIFKESPIYKSRVVKEL